MSTADPAKRRFWLLNLARFAGIILVLLGMTGFSGKGSVSEAQGAVLMAGGLMSFFGLPTLLAKHWKSKE